MVLIALLTNAPQRPDACSCRPSGPPCSEVFQADALFTGTVIRIRPTRDARIVTFRVERTWRLETNRELQRIVDVSTNDGLCGDRFQVGEQYLVYAQRGAHGDAQLATSRCSRTRRVEDSTDDLAFLRDLEGGGRQSRISGRVQARDQHGAWSSLAGVIVELHRGDDVWGLAADQDGRFEFVGMPPGRYHVFPRDYLVDVRMTSTSAPIEHEGVCVEIDLFVRLPPP